MISKFERGDILLLQNEINELSYIIDKAYERGLEIILNPSPYDQNLEGCDFGKISMFLLNEIEGEQITGVCKPEEILDELKERFPGVKVVLTLGGQGAVYQDQERCCRQGIYQVEAVDTTGAGDTFTGYFIASMLQGKEPQQCPTLAAKASAIAVPVPAPRLLSLKERKYCIQIWQRKRRFRMNKRQTTSSNRYAE